MSWHVAAPLGSGFLPRNQLLFSPSAPDCIHLPLPTLTCRKIQILLPCPPLPIHHPIGQVHGTLGSHLADFKKLNQQITFRSHPSGRISFKNSEKFPGNSSMRTGVPWRRPEHPRKAFLAGPLRPDGVATPPLPWGPLLSSARATSPEPCTHLVQGPLDWDVSG